MKKQEIIKVLADVLKSKTRAIGSEKIRNLINDLQKEVTATPDGKRGRKKDVARWEQAFDEYVANLVPGEPARTEDPKQYDISIRVRNGFPKLFGKVKKKIHFLGTQDDIEYIKNFRNAAVANKLDAQDYPSEQKQEQEQEQEQKQEISAPEVSDKAPQKKGKKKKAKPQPEPVVETLMSDDDIDELLDSKVDVSILYEDDFDTSDDDNDEFIQNYLDGNIKIEVI